MKVVIQVSKNASVVIDDKVVGHIDNGYTILVGISNEDTKEIVEKMANKIVGLRIFKDSNDKTNLSLILIQLNVLVTPGLLPVVATFLFTSLFIKVDLPTLGIPTINTLPFLIF